MELNEIKFLADLMEERGLTSLEIEEGERSIRMQRQQTSFEPLPVPTVTVPAPVPVASKVEPEAAEDGVVDFNGVTELKSPMVGTVYVSPTPGSEPYVKVGDKVKKGQVLCIIEAMKLMNEYTAPQDGEIVDVCIRDGELVEYGQCLFKLY
ncbi:MAG TPA: acetyl-CoA carboxylase biotin carboxyl carrier protein [Candidatus Caccousia avicola]|uniref:Biotin carboxyl carrier protein of acetyl-CoA carboxylase n=1 Tax=Candidatus Caccousia avicola TaxID=2840721 RepID=A0A9D1DDQ9_9FIRM|nr:acetyl-CoA carboxylase biotin carboxyl carrier protein [Candidatus Caccousia avicola]